MAAIQDILRMIQQGNNPWRGWSESNPSPMGTDIRGGPGAINAGDQSRVQANLAGGGYIPQGRGGYLPQSYAGQDETARARLAAQLTGKLLGAPMSPADRAVALKGIRGESANLENFMGDIEAKVGANLERKNPVTLQSYVPEKFRKDFGHIQAIPEKTGMAGRTIPAYGTPSKQEMAQYRALREVWPVESAPPNRFLSSVFQRYR